MTMSKKIKQSDHDRCDKMLEEIKFHHANEIKTL